MKRENILSKYMILGLVTAIMSGCAVPAPTTPTLSQAPVSASAERISTAGLESVLGLTEPQLVRKFGTARLDVREANGRKLQFSGNACIMDVYLYAEDSGSEVATHIDARRSDGAEVDRASCVRALSQR